MIFIGEWTLDGMLRALPPAVREEKRRRIAAVTEYLTHYTIWLQAKILGIRLDSADMDIGQVNALSIIQSKVLEVGKAREAAEGSRWQSKLTSKS